MIEVACVFDRKGVPLYWHRGRDEVSIPDSKRLWDECWERRAVIGGVAHTHPGSGIPVASKNCDVTTFAAMESVLGRLVWPIVTVDMVTYYQWVGPGELDYKPVKPRRHYTFTHKLRELSFGGVNGTR